jgi:hypothetical protein
MSGYRERLRRAAAGLGQALGPRRPGVELVRVDQPAPAAPSRRLALPAPEWPVCPRCRTRHEPRPLPARTGGRGGGLSAYRDTPVLPDPNRPTPLNREAADVTLALRRFRPWSAP